MPCVEDGWLGQRVRLVPALRLPYLPKSLQKVRSSTLHRGYHYAKWTGSERKLVVKVFHCVCINQPENEVT